MKKILIFIIILFTIGVIFYFSKSKKPVQFSDYQVINYQLENKNLHLLVADTPQKWEQGLMNVKKLDTGINGMIFIFPTKEIRTFWNKNTLVDLDVYWLNNKQIVGKDFLPAITKDNETKFIISSQEVNRVIEIPKLSF